MPSRSPSANTSKRLDELVYAVQELERQSQTDRETLAGILDKVDEFHEALSLTLSITDRSQPRISTAFEEAAVMLDRERENGYVAGSGKQHQGNLFA
jgi:hypothetical protein